jgi:hypothetical protein
MQGTPEATAAMLRQDSTLMKLYVLLQYQAKS